VESILGIKNKFYFYFKIHPYTPKAPLGGYGGAQRPHPLRGKEEYNYY
jgi:hypothetical protein